MLDMFLLQALDESIAQARLEKANLEAFIEACLLQSTGKVTFFGNGNDDDGLPF